MTAVFGDVSQVVATGLAIAAFGTAAEQYIVQNLMSNRRVILDRQRVEEDAKSSEFTQVRELCGGDGTLPFSLTKLKESLEKYDQEKEDLIAIEVQEALKLGLPFFNTKFGASGFSSTYAYILAAVVYSVSTYFCGIQLTQMPLLHELNNAILGLVRFPYTVNAFLNISIITLIFQTVIFSRFIWKSLMLRSKISRHSETLRSLGESIIGQGQFAKYVSDATGPKNDAE